MKGRRSIRQNPLWDWDGIFDNIISRYLREQTEWAKNGEGGRGVEITSWNDGLQTKSKCRLWLAGTTTRPSLWVWGHDTSSVHVVPASPKRKGGQEKSLHWNVCLGSSPKTIGFERNHTGTGDLCSSVFPTQSHFYQAPSCPLVN